MTKFILAEASLLGHLLTTLSSHSREQVSELLPFSSEKDTNSMSSGPHPCDLI